MSRKPSTQTNPGLVEEFINTAYDNVKLVADNITDVIEVAEAIRTDGFQDITDNLPEILDAANQATIATAGANAAKASELLAAAYTDNLFISGGIFTPTLAQEYPPTDPHNRDIQYIIDIADWATYTYTTGDLVGKSVKSLDLLYFDASLGKWQTVVNPSAAAILEVNGKSGTSIELTSVDIPHGGSSVSQTFADVASGALSVGKANTLTTPRAIGVALTGEAVGTASASFDGSAAIAITVATTVPNKANKYNLINTPVNSGLKGGGDLTANRDLSVDVVGLSETMSPSGSDVLVIETATGLKKISRDNLLASVAGGVQIRGEIALVIPNDPNAVVVQGDPLNPTIAQGVAPVHGGVSPNGFSYVLKVNMTTYPNGVAISIGGTAGNPEELLVANQDQLVWLGDHWAHLETGDSVVSVHGRHGQVVSADGDYAAAQVTVTPTGTLQSTRVQGALAELDGDNSALSARLDNDEVLAFAKTEVQFEAERAINRRRFAASGYESFGKQNDSNFVNQGLWSYYDQIDKNCLFMGESGGVTVGNSKSPYGVLHVAGVMFDIKNIASTLKTQSIIKFPQAPDGKTTYNKAAGVNTVHASASDAFAAQAADPTNVEVVINRVDMWGKEVWAEEVNQTNPYIYSNGLPQSTAANMDGIATSDSNRPTSYYSFYIGDVISKGKGVNYFTLTDEQKKKVLSNPKNNLVLLSDGRLIQWRLRIRTFAGFGNGDWLNVSSVIDADLIFSQVSGVNSQGMRDSLGNTGFVGNVNEWNPVRELYGVFPAISGKGQLDASAGVNGECYFLVGGTVKRLNQGAYHHSYNPSGSGRGVNFTETGWARWWQADAKQITSTSACFVPYASGGVADGSGFVGSIAGGSELSGRPDGRYYNGIYVDGDGGVCRDMRYSAYGMLDSDYSKAKVAVRNGTYRGFEKQVFTRIAVQIGDSVSVAGSLDIEKSSIPYTPVVGEYLHGLDANTGKYFRSVITSVSQNGSETIWWFGIDRTISRVSGSYVILEQPLPSSVGGLFLQTDVVANPANLVATPALAKGWLGKWIPRIPNGVDQNWPATRKNLNYNLKLFTADNGINWTSGTLNFDSVGNVFNDGATPQNEVIIYQYLAYAKQTKGAELLPIYGAEPATILVSQEPRKEFSVLVGETTLSVVATNVPALTMKGAEQLYLTELCVDNANRVYGGKNDNSIGITRHPAISIGASVSPAFKTLMYGVTKNQQASLQLISTELRHNGANWGDDQKVTATNYESTKVDTNGTTVKTSTHELAEPIGWIYNNV